MKLMNLTAAALCLSGSAFAAEKTIVETAVAAGQFNTLVAAVKAAGLADELSGTGPFTVFAPTDEAFAKLPEGTVEALLEDTGKLANILLYHVVSGKVMAADVGGITSADTLLGQPAAVSTKGGVTIAGAKVVKTDIECSNGVIHVIDTVMMPKNIVDVAAGAGSFGTLLKAAQAAGLAETLANDGPFTVFAPTDEAFAKLPAGTVAELLKPENKEKLAAILKHHVVAGKVMAADAVKLTEASAIDGMALPIAVKKASDGSVSAVHVGGATVTATDIVALNGVIHVVDTVILPHE